MMNTDQLLVIDDPLVRARAVKGWAFENLPDDDVAAIRRFLKTGAVRDLPVERQRLAEKYATGELG